MPLKTLLKFPFRRRQRRNKNKGKRRRFKLDIDIDAVLDIFKYPRYPDAVVVYPQPAYCGGYPPVCSKYSTLCTLLWYYTVLFCSVPLASRMNKENCNHENSSNKWSQFLFSQRRSLSTPVCGVTKNACNYARIN